MRAWLDVDLDIIRRNYQSIQQLIGRTVGIIAVVKSDAYGLGLEVVGETLDLAGADMLAVVDWAELIQLRRVTTKPILILGYLDVKELTAAISQNEVFTLYDRDQIPLVERLAQRLNKLAHVHLKIDTGLHRLGLTPKEAAEFLTSLRLFPHIRVQALYSHLSTAKDRVANLEQLRQIQDLLVEIQGKVPVLPIHLVSSRALADFPEGYFDAVRVGLALYGTEEMVPRVELALAVKSVVMQLKQLGRGDTVGYDQTFVADRLTTIATLAIGYGDGLPTTGPLQVLIKGQRFPLVGRISMNLAAANIGQAVVKPGDEVVIFGSQKNDAGQVQTISVADIAKTTNLRHHEIVSRFGLSLPKRYLT